MEDSCEICVLPYLTKNQIEGMIHGRWTPEDLEHWIALLFRLKIQASVVKHHSEWCLMHPPPFMDQWEVARPEPSLAYYTLFPREAEKKHPTTAQASKPPKMPVATGPP